MKTQIMLDLETLGTLPGSVLVAIGAVKFDGEKITDEFYVRIDAASCAKLGLQMDTETVLWWLQQADGPRLEITKPAVGLAEALYNFSAWVGDDEAEMWGNGAAFDNVLLAGAYRAAGQKPPWEFWHDRCYRTMKNLYPQVTMQREGVHHHALDDARAQARHLMAIFRRAKFAPVEQLVKTLADVSGYLSAMRTDLRKIDEHGETWALQTLRYAEGAKEYTDKAYKILDAHDELSAAGG